MPEDNNTYNNPNNDDYNEGNYTILNIDYNNIQSQKGLENIIIEYKAMIENMIKQIHELISIRDKEQEEKEIILNRMQENKIKNEKQISAFKNAIYQTNDDYENYLKVFGEEKEKAKKGIEIQHNSEMNEINKHIEELEAEYRGLREFEEKESEYQAKIEELKKNLIVKQYEHHDNMNKEESLQLKENVALQQKKSGEIVETKKNAHPEAVYKVSKEVDKNEELNLALKAKLIKLQDDLGKLKKERNDIVNKRKDLKINVSLNQEELEEYKAVGSLQKVKIKAYKDKIESIKIRISEEVSKRESKLKVRKHERETFLKSIKEKLFNLEQEKENLRIRMEQMKTLGETILFQRGEVEEFFIMAMETSRREVEAYEKKTFKTEKDEKHYGEKVDLEDLLPQDKQRIITNLYTKLAFSSSK